MKRVALTVALAAAMAMAAPPGWAAQKAASACAAPGAAEAEAAIRYMTDLMVVSSACKNTIYAEFRLRNKDAIIAYQNTLIRRFHGAAAFDHWNTSLANLAAQKEASVPPAQFCQQSEPLLKHASALDTRAFRAYAAAQAGGQAANCGK